MRDIAKLVWFWLLEKTWVGDIIGWLFPKRDDGEGRFE